MTAPSKHQWFKSSYSGGSGTECVECARVDGGVLVRDSKHEGGPVLTFQQLAWQSFTNSPFAPSTASTSSSCQMTASRAGCVTAEPR